MTEETGHIDMSDAAFKTATVSLSPEQVAELLAVPAPPPPQPELNLDSLGIEGPGRISDKERQARIRRAFKFDPPFRSAVELKDLWTGETLCIVGGGPSIEQTLPELIDLIAGGAKVMAVNMTHDWLIERGVIPTFGIVCDPAEWVVSYQTPTPGVKYLIASQCCDAVFEKFRDVPEVFLFHAEGINEDRKIIYDAAVEARLPTFSVVGGSTTSHRGQDIAALLLGFAELRFFGLDSSAAGNRMHPYDKPHLDPVNIPFKLLDPSNGRELHTIYWTNKPMFHQLRQFEIVLAERREGIRAGRYPKIRLAFHGSGLLPDWAALRGLHIDPTRAAYLRSVAEPPVLEGTAVEVSAPSTPTIHFTTPEPLV